MISESRPVHFSKRLICFAAAVAFLIAEGGPARAELAAQAGRPAMIARPARAERPDRQAAKAGAEQTANASGQNRSWPRFQGNTVFSDRQLQAVLLGGGWDPSSPDAAVGRLQQLYFREGFLLTRIRLEQLGPETVLVIEEGEAARYGRTAVRGATLFSESEIRHLLGLESGGRFNPRQLDRNIEELLRRYDAAGYPFVQVWVDSLDMHPVAANSIDLGLFIIEGGRKMLQEVRISGLKKTRPELVLELSGLKTGEPYRPKAIEDAYLRLKAGRIFEEVQYPVIKLSGRDGVAAFIDLREPERFNTFSLALGYVRQSTKNDEELSGNVRLNLQNIGGTLRDLSVFWNNNGSGKDETRLAFKDRFVLGRNLALGIHLEQVGLDTLYTWQSIGLELERPLAGVGGNLLSLSGAVFADRNVFSEGDLLRSWRLRTAAGLSFLKSTTEGQGIGRFDGRFDGRVTLAWKKFYRRSRPDGERLTQLIVETNEKIEFDLNRLLHLMNESVYRGLESSEAIVPLSEQFYMGGARTLRGYREDQFHGRRIAYSRSEFIVGKREVDNAYLFLDGGYVLIEGAGAEGRVDRKNHFRTGYGFGLKSASKFGRVDLSFGIGERPSLRQTMIHVILEQTF
jgi:outer membrane protein insertion porin family